MDFSLFMQIMIDPLILGSVVENHMVLFLDPYYSPDICYLWETSSGNIVSSLTGVKVDIMSLFP